MDVDLDRDVPSYSSLEIEGEVECRQILSGMIRLVGELGNPEVL
jgi:hypothetical protein